MISLRNGTVMEHCQAVLQGAEPLLLSQLPLMRAALSYIDALVPLEEAAPSSAGATLAAALSAKERPSQEGKEGKALPPLECYWALPLIRVFDDHPPEAELVERMVALVAAPKPTLEVEPSAAVAAAGGARPDAAAGLLQGSDEEPPRCEALLAEADAPLAEALSGVVGDIGGFASPLLQRLCVGLLSPAATSYAWDLCLLGGWQQLQPLFAAVLLALKDGLLGCGTEEAVAAYLLQEGPRVPVASLQSLMERHFMPAIREALGGVPAALGDEGLQLWTAPSMAVGN